MRNYFIFSHNFVGQKCRQGLFSWAVFNFNMALTEVTLIFSWRVGWSKAQASFTLCLTLKAESWRTVLKWECPLECLPACGSWLPESAAGDPGERFKASYGQFSKTPKMSILLHSMVKQVTKASSGEKEWIWEHILQGEEYQTNCERALSITNHLYNIYHLPRPSKFSFRSSIRLRLRSRVLSHPKV